MRAVLIAAVVGSLLAALVVLTGTHYYYGMQIADLKHTADVRTAEAAAKSTQLQQQRDAAAVDKSKAVATIQGESNDALDTKQVEINKLSTCLSTAACRLRYGPGTAVSGGDVSKTTGSTSSNNAASGEPDAAAQSAYISLVAGIERQAIALRACQMYAEEIQR